MLSVINHILAIYYIGSFFLSLALRGVEVFAQKLLKYCHKARLGRFICLVTHQTHSANM